LDACLRRDRADPKGSALSAISALENPGPGHGAAGLPVGAPHVRGHPGLAEETVRPVHVVV